MQGMLKGLAVSAAVFAFSGCIASGEPQDGSAAAARAAAAAAPSADQGGNTKVTICHYPPGNPRNMRTLTVGAPAVSAHLAHGDKLGACSAGDGGGDGEGGGDGGGAVDTLPSGEY